MDETGEIARETSSQAGSNWVTGLASAVALLFSGISLYHSVLKQPEIKIYVPSIIHYTSDPAVDGEVFVVPVTVANHGARDGTVLRMTLTATALSDGTTKTFETTYAVGEDYFVKPAGYDTNARRFERVDRPRTPFAPISVAGRSHFTGTLLFYRTSPKEFPRVVEQEGRYRVTIKTDTIVDETLGPIDKALHKPVAEVSFEFDLKRRVQDRDLKRGATRAIYRRASAPTVTE